MTRTATARRLAAGAAYGGDANFSASLLTPIEPLDGGFVAKGPAGVAAGLALLGTAVFMLLGLA